MKLLGCIAAIALLGAVAACDSASGASRAAKAAADSRARRLDRARTAGLDQPRATRIRRRLDSSESRKKLRRFQRSGWWYAGQRAPARQPVARRARRSHCRRRRAWRLGRPRPGGDHAARVHRPGLSELAVHPPALPTVTGPRLDVDRESQHHRLPTPCDTARWRGVQAGELHV